MGEWDNGFLDFKAQQIISNAVCTCKPFSCDTTPPPSSVFAVLPSEIIISIVKLLEPRAIGSLVRTCRYFYVLFFEDAIWESLLCRHNLPMRPLGWGRCSREWFMEVYSVRMSRFGHWLFRFHRGSLLVYNDFYEAFSGCAFYFGGWLADGHCLIKGVWCSVDVDFQTCIATAAPFPTHLIARDDPDSTPPPQLETLAGGALQFGCWRLQAGAGATRSCFYIRYAPSTGGAAQPRGGGRSLDALVLPAESTGHVTLQHGAGQRELSAAFSPHQNDILLA